MNIPRVIAAILLAALFSAGSTTARSQELTGRQIMERDEKQNKGEDEYNKMSWKLINKRGQERNRRVEYYRRTDENDNDKVLIRFLEPADVKGVGLLTIEHTDRDDDQWLYLPALRKVRRISASDQTDNFMGTDFTYEDIRSEKLDEHRYNLIGSEVIDGHDCYLIEALPATEKQKKESGYSRRELWVRKDIFLRVQAKYYDKKGEYVKIGSRRDIVEAVPNIYRPNYMEMKNLKTGHTTQLRFDERRINSGIDDNVFTERTLKRG
ncbi:MAG: outer membrane lipoprotein-sorting protein [Candidatus Hydrogenedentota bacterium]|nr:MAG: outer membrane lipoprotein-sorting protein [Candidatus Hydrogenedentota bacterium]